MNQIEVCGHLQGELHFSHKTRNGEKMYVGEIISPRLSGKQDIIPVTVSSQMLAQVNELAGKTARLRGQLRSYIWRVNGKGQSRMTLYVSEAEESPESTMNQVDLIGEISRDPVYRITPFGREICDVMLAVERTHKRKSYIPCVAWGPNAKLLSLCNVGDRLSITGRIQSREYEKVLDNGEKIHRVIQEVSIFRMDAGMDADDERMSDLYASPSL